MHYESLFHPPVMCKYILFASLTAASVWVISYSFMSWPDSGVKEFAENQSLLKLKSKSFENIRKFKYRGVNLILPLENKLDFKDRNENVRKYFRKRLKIVRNVCDKYAETPKTGNRTKLKIFSLEPRKKILLCRTAKEFGQPSQKI